MIKKEAKKCQEKAQKGIKKERKQKICDSKKSKQGKTQFSCCCKNVKPCHIPFEP